MDGPRTYTRHGCVPSCHSRRKDLLLVPIKALRSRGSATVKRLWRESRQLWRLMMTKWIPPSKDESRPSEGAKANSKRFRTESVEEKYPGTSEAATARSPWH